jgi:hypothetical protein
VDWQRSRLAQVLSKQVRGERLRVERLLVKPVLVEPVVAERALTEPALLGARQAAPSSRQVQDEDEVSVPQVRRPHARQQ